MKIESHVFNNYKVAEIISDEILINNVGEGLSLLGDLYYQGFDRIILSEQNLHTDFFDLKTKMAGDLLQKFSQYKMGLSIIGDFSKYSSKSLQDFIIESNKGKLINFVGSLPEALKQR
ncbi:MAG: DUF4180 domain-containing protein [Pedobacter sp.]|nr:MAG: DUF4180 domain-containing protein [Pedobacter sp.]